MPTGLALRSWQFNFAWQISELAGFCLAGISPRSNTGVSPPAVSIEHVDGFENMNPIGALTDVIFAYWPAVNVRILSPESADILPPDFNIAGEARVIES